MMSVLDGFDRASLGANWETPAYPVSENNDALGMISGLDGIEASTTGNTYCSGIYIGQEFTYDKQYADIEYLNPVEFEDYANYVDDYASNGPMLNVSKAVDANLQGAHLEVWPTMSSSYYNTIYWQIMVRDLAGDASWLAWDWIPYEHFFSAKRIPIGTRIRFERVGDTYHAMMYSPDTGRWHYLGSAIHGDITGGYPGARLFGDQPIHAQATNFRAGSSEDDFLVQGPSYKPGNQDTSGNRNKRESRFWYPGANDVTYRLGDNDKPSVGTFDNKSRNRFS